MAAKSMEELVALEVEHGLGDDGLTYQQRLSRISKIEKGEEWEMPEQKEIKRGTIFSEKRQIDPREDLKRHELYGKRLLITPLMKTDKNRALYFDETLGHEIEVEEVSAGPLLYGSDKDLDRVVGDYKIISENPNRMVVAKTSIPKTGQEISWLLGKELVPVVRGNDGQRGYVWGMPSHVRQYKDTLVQIYGLKTLITQIYPELLPRFSNKPVMMYIDGFVLAASIPQTDAILKEHRRREIKDAKLGLD